MGTQPSALATSWKELLGVGGGLLKNHRENVRMLPELLPQEVAFGDPVQIIGSYASSVCAVATADGPAAVCPVLAALKGTVDAALPRLMPKAFEPMSAVGFLSFLNVVECAGSISSPLDGVDAKALIGAVVKGKAGLSEKELHRAAFAAVGTGGDALVPKLLGHKSKDTFEPGRTFGFNSVGFLQYLALAQAEGANAEAVAPAFDEFVRAFPRKLGAGTLDWPELLWAARGHLHRLGGTPVSQVVAELHDKVLAAP